MRYGLIGEHLAHSFSKTIHEKMGMYEYGLMQVARQDIDAFMKKRDFRAINVTIPYKQTVIPYLDKISPRAELIGAVNTIVNNDGMLYGDNTDFGGMNALIKKTGLDIFEKKVLILGTGGTSNTAYAVAKSLGAGSIYKVSRSKKNGALSYEQMYKQHADAHIIINTTPCGMFPKANDIPAEPKKFVKLDGVLDAIYNPLSTRLVTRARQAGAKAQGGLYMLVAQAVLAAEIFTGKTLGEEMINDIYQRLLSKKRNIVLIGLPSSGKTTAGIRLSELTGREFIDSDDEIVKRIKMPISQFFAERGERAFRDIEEAVIEELSMKNGVIIATGGGVPLRGSNIEALKSNGVLVFIDRDPDTLIPTDDRPLFNEKNKMKRLYEERYPVYTEAADIHFKANCDYEEAGDEILKLLSLKEKVIA